MHLANATRPAFWVNNERPSRENAKHQAPLLIPLSSVRIIFRDVVSQTSASGNQRLAARFLPSGEYATAMTAFPPLVNSGNTFPSANCCTCSAPLPSGTRYGLPRGESCLSGSVAVPIASILPSGDIAKATNASSTTSALRSSLPERVFHIRTVPSKPPVTSRDPSGLNANEVMAFLCPENVCFSFPLRESNKRGVSPSRPAATATAEPSGESNTIPAFSPLGR